jgi:hypothetical protein
MFKLPRESKITPNVDPERCWLKHKWVDSRFGLPLFRYNKFAQKLVGNKGRIE